MLLYSCFTGRFGGASESDGSSRKLLLSSEAHMLSCSRVLEGVERAASSSCSRSDAAGPAPLMRSERRGERK